LRQPNPLAFVAAVAVGPWEVLTQTLAPSSLVDARQALTEEADDPVQRRDTGGEPDPEPMTTLKGGGGSSGNSQRLPPTDSERHNNSNIGRLPSETCFSPLRLA
jgi:hypothetical protein